MQIVIDGLEYHRTLFRQKTGAEARASRARGMSQPDMLAGGEPLA